MKNILNVLLTVVLLINIPIIYAISRIGTGSFKERQAITKPYSWIKSQQDSETGLFHSYDMPGDENAWTYDQAMAIIALTSSSDTKIAEKCADRMLKLRDKKFKAWADGYHAGTGIITARPIAVGPNAWMGIALLRLHLVTQEPKYLTAAEELAEFMLVLQVQGGKAAGSVPGGYDENGGLFNWTSTEHNVDFIAFMAGLYKVTQKEMYYQASLNTAEWLHREMWNSTEKCYYPGYSNNDTLEISQFHERLDSQTWSILALTAAKNLCQKKEFEQYTHNGLPWIDQYRQKFSYQDHELTGFSKITLGEDTLPSIWPEGTAGYILAAKTIGHKTDFLESLIQSLKKLQNKQGALPHSVGITFPEIAEQFKPGDTLIAHFESHPNCLFGNVGLHGDGEPNWEAIKEAEFKKPFSWYYEPSRSGYLKENVHSGVQSFCLVNASDMCLTRNRGWASLGLDLGFRNEKNQIKPFDAGQYKEFSFWAKTSVGKGAQIEVGFRDAGTKSYLPQASADITPMLIDKSWRKYTVDLYEIRHKVNLAKLVHISLAFGKDVGNTPGTVIFVDDVAFTGHSRVLSRPNQISMPAKFPQHWPYNNVGATAWLLFVELNINPFEVSNSNEIDHPLIIDSHNADSSEKNNKPEGISRSAHSSKTNRIGIGDWLSLSANLDLSYRKTQFYQAGHETTMFQWDTRADFWLPPGSDEFSWGPYIRFSGVESNRPYEFENNWGARPGYGFQVYPFSSQEMR